MCGRLTQRPTSEMAAIFGAEDRLDDVAPHHNVAPTQRIAVVVERPDNARAVVGYRWGLVPFWTDRKARVPGRMFNARAETVAIRPAFRGPLAKHRLIVPADGFYEWRRGPELARQPYYIRRADGRPLALAGPPVGLLARSRTTARRLAAAFGHDLDDRAELAHGPDPQPDAGHPARTRVGSLA